MTGDKNDWLVQQRFYYTLDIAQLIICFDSKKKILLTNKSFFPVCLREKAAQNITDNLHRE